MDFCLTSQTWNGSQFVFSNQMRRGTFIQLSGITTVMFRVGEPGTSSILKSDPEFGEQSTITQHITQSSHFPTFKQFLK